MTTQNEEIPRDERERELRALLQSASSARTPASTPSELPREKA
jgi:hypothetical protein